MARLLKRHGPCRLGAKHADGSFAALARSIVFQQLAGKAAASIHGRFEKLVRGEVTARKVGRLEVSKLRSAGLSEAKARSILDLATKSQDGTVDLSRITRKKDEKIIEELVQVRGIGPWTAQMFLIFQLRRLDVWPTLDYGVRKGYQAAYSLKELPTPRELEGAGARFSPYRSVAAWYCWRALDDDGDDAWA